MMPASHMMTTTTTTCTSFIHPSINDDFLPLHSLPVQSIFFSFFGTPSNHHENWSINAFIHPTPSTVRSGTYTAILEFGLRWSAVACRPALPSVVEATHLCTSWREARPRSCVDTSYAVKFLDHGTRFSSGTKERLACRPAEWALVGTAVGCGCQT